jgi:hypothetical protein
MSYYDWNEDSGSIRLDRMFEYTDDHLSNQFKDGALPALDRLTALPCLFIPEGTGDQVCRVGKITAARIRGKEVVFEYALDKYVPPMLNSFLFSHKKQLDMNYHSNSFDWNRTHWAVKDVDLYHFLLSNLNPRRQRPSVFTIAEHEKIEETLMSVMMPFDASFASVYCAIREASDACELRTRRADEIWEAPGIIQDVVSLIDRGRIVVCDLTGRNPNVFYEAGIAHTLGRDVIIITQSEQDVPFDLRHLRYIKYLNNKEGLDALKSALEARVRTILGTGV